MKAVYCGSFDPITFGHEAVINASAKMYENLTVLVATNESKKHLFDINERVKLVESSVPKSVSVNLLSSGMMLAEFCRINKIDIIVRGLRNLNDLEYELQIAAVNADQCSAQTVFIPAPHSLGHVSSSMVREVASLGGKLSKYVNIHVIRALTKKLTP